MSDSELSSSVSLHENEASGSSDSTSEPETNARRRRSKKTKVKKKKIKNTLLDDTSEVQEQVMEVSNQSFNANDDAIEANKENSFDFVTNFFWRFVLIELIAGSAELIANLISVLAFQPVRISVPSTILNDQVSFALTQNAIITYIVMMVIALVVLCLSIAKLMWPAKQSIWASIWLLVMWLVVFGVLIWHVFGLFLVVWLNLASVSLAVLPDSSAVVATLMFVATKYLDNEHIHEPKRRTFLWTSFMLMLIALVFSLIIAFSSIAWVPQLWLFLQFWAMIGIALAGTIFSFRALKGNDPTTLHAHLRRCWLATLILCHFPIWNASRAILSLAPFTLVLLLIAMRQSAVSFEYRSL